MMEFFLIVYLFVGQANVVVFAEFRDGFDCFCKFVDFFLVFVDPCSGFFLSHGGGLIVFLFNLSAPFRPAGLMVSARPNRAGQSVFYAAQSLHKKTRIVYIL